MADALVSIALEKLTHVIGQKLSLFADATRDLQKLSCTFESIQAVLADAESRQVGEKHVQLWLSRLRHVCYDIEDLVEDRRISGPGDEEGNEDVGNRRKKPRLWFNFAAYNPLDYALSRRDVVNTIKEIKERLDLIDVERNSFGFSRSPPGGDHSMFVRSWRLTTSLFDESYIIGRENDKETMISRLVSGSSSNEDGGQVQVVAIAGIGGLGKTTLARLLYHDAKVRDHFEKDLYWVCVSEPFDVLRLTKDIIEEVKREPPTLSGLNVLQDELLQCLRGKRFLLVLDDVWNDDADKWELLRLSLTSGAKGSRILVTARSEKVVANTMNANYIHELKGLSDDQSWTLFSGRAFGGRREGDCTEFESIGKEIVNKCKGVPLSIKVIGNAMKTKRTVEDWKNVLESKIWSLPQAADKILPALLLTYCHLPPRLKQCFVYCSMFPKDWTFEKDMLIRLWVAQGFIQSEESREKEDIGGEYFDELVAWSMFQEIVKGDEGNIRCKMHDLLHDLAEFIAKDEIYTFIGNSKGGKSEECSGSSCRDVRHAYLYFTGSDDKPIKIPIAAPRAKKLRTLCIDINPAFLKRTDDVRVDSVIYDLLHQARFLRALSISSSISLQESIGKLKHLTYLHLPWSKIAELPDAVGKLKQLRYLDLSYSPILLELPESASDLCNLHTLNLSKCLHLKKLPKGIGRMVSLKYLNLAMSSNIVELPESVCDLRNLQTLNLSYSKLEKLPRGIGGMEQLTWLDLSNNSNLVELPESVSDLRNLHTLNLSHCGKLKKLPRRTGGMACLRHLEIEGTDSLEYLPKELGGISGLLSLSKFTVGGGDEGEGCGIDELQPLNSLRGTLQIEHLERVSSREEAEKAQLRKKQHLCSLVLSMLAGRNDDVGTERIYGVLEGLQPHESVEELKLAGLTGSKLPSWMDGLRRLRKLVLASGLILERLPDLPSLKEFQIWGLRNEILPDEGWEPLESLESFSVSSCQKLQSVPDSLGQLKKLKSLDVGGSDVLRCLPDSVGQLESLESLSVRSCTKLESLPNSLGQLRKLRWLEVGGSEVLRCLPDSVGQLESLDSLSVRSCKKLESLPNSLGQLRKLRSLEVDGSDVLRCLPDSVGQLESLVYFYVRSCKKLESLPNSLGQLRKLGILQVGGSEVLRCLPDSVGQLESLDSLSVRSCKKLESLPNSLGQLRKLRSLEVDGSEVLRCLPDSVGQLESLDSLSVSSCKKLESLPNSLGQLRKLHSLHVGGSEVLRCLPDSVGQLESLERLQISKCKKLESLPNSLGQLRKLKSLDVDGSEVLRCLPDSVGQL